MLEAEEIQKIIPHRYPFLLVDRILEIEHGARAVGLKNVSVNEAFFQGHFPDMPIMPGVLQIEALAQVGAVAVLSMPENKGKIAYFAALDNVRFRRPVKPGDQLILEVTLERARGRIGTGRGVAKVNNEITAEGKFTFALGDTPKE